MTVVEAVTAEPESAIRTIHTDLPVNATFHVWLKAKKAGEPGAVSFSNQNGKFAEVSSVNTEEYGFRIYQVFWRRPCGAELRHGHHRRFGDLLVHGIGCTRNRHHGCPYQA